MKKKIDYGTTADWKITKLDTKAGAGEEGRMETDEPLKQVPVKKTGFAHGQTFTAEK